MINKWLRATVFDDGCKGAQINVRVGLLANGWLSCVYARYQPVTLDNVQAVFRRVRDDGRPWPGDDRLILSRADYNALLAEGETCHSRHWMRR